MILDVLEEGKTGEKTKHQRVAQTLSVKGPLTPLLYVTTAFFRIADGLEGARAQ